ncbi:MAG: TetR/AcrR family transcriptional regulator [Actinomycetota bacterium]
MSHRYGTLSREVAAEAAVALGFENLTVAAVAERLGVTAAALYYHVKDRNDLVVAAIEWAMAASLEPIDEIASVGTFVRAEAMAMYKMFKNHPGLTAAIHSLAEPPPSFTERFERAHGQLTSQGVPVADAYFMLVIVYSHVLHSGTWLTSRQMMTADLSGSDEPPTDVWSMLAANPPDDSFQRMTGLLIDGAASLDRDGDG